MGRPFDFDDATKNSARLRQFGKCAVCNDSMDDLYEQAHHVVPNQSGQLSNPDDAWLKAEENCVVLCEECHYIVHDSGRYQRGGVAPPEVYCFSHGEDRVQHHAWVERLNLKIDRLWGPSPIPSKLRATTPFVIQKRRRRRG